MDKCIYSDIPFWKFNYFIFVHRREKKKQALRFLYDNYVKKNKKLKIL